MNFCSRHVHDLGQEIKRRGMAKLIQHQSSEAVSNFARGWLTGDSRREDFDPLIVSMLEINAKAERTVGWKLSGCCPLCETARVLRDVEVAHKWIVGFSDQMLVIAKSNGLVAQ